MQRMREGVVDTAAEELRKTHIKHEASIQSVGLLYFLGGALAGIAGVMMLFVTVSGSSPDVWQTGVIGVGVLGIAVVQVATGVGLRRLKRWARVPSVLLSGIGLLVFPLGTLINAWILYLVLCRKGSKVFSDDYQRIIAATPHIKYRTSIIVWIFLAILVLLLALIPLGYLLSR
jgi:hypothetical protein